MFLRWQGKWTFFEGIVTDLGPATISPSPESSDPVINILPQPIADPQNTINSNPTGNITQHQTRNVSKGGEKWWVHNGPPEYLSSEKVDDSAPAKLPTYKSSENARFQQPEPRDPYGIRFPIINSSRLKHKFLGGTFHGEHINPYFVSQE